MLVLSIVACLLGLGAEERAFGILLKSGVDPLEAAVDEGNASVLLPSLPDCEPPSVTVLAEGEEAIAIVLPVSVEVVPVAAIETDEAAGEGLDEDACCC